MRSPSTVTEPKVVRSIPATRLRIVVLLLPKGTIATSPPGRLESRSDGNAAALVERGRSALLFPWHVL